MLLKQQQRNQVVRSVPGIAPVVLLFLVEILLFTMVGMVLFNQAHVQNVKEGIYDDDANHDANFLDPATAMLKLMYLLAGSVNFPNLMQVDYNLDPWVSIFYIVFLLIGLFFLFNLILAATYWHFNRYTYTTVLSLRFMIGYIYIYIYI